MGQKTIISIIDDLDGEELEQDDAQTVRFALDGVQYELDVSHDNADQLRQILAPYVENGRRTGGRRTSGGHTKRVQTEVDTRAVREWAVAHGIQVSRRGRIPADVIERYRQAGN